jgi:hypothetical protein
MKPTNISLGEKDWENIQKIRDQQRIASTAAVIRWALNEALKPKETQNA